MQISKRMEKLPKADIREMTRECERLNGYNLSQGVCDLPTPPAILEAAAAATMKDLSVYAPAAGLPELRALIGEKVRTENKISIDDSDVIVTNGVTGAFASILTALFDPGDGVMLIEPYYGYHYAECVVTLCEPQVAELDANFKISIDQLTKALKPNTKAIVVCSPANPSGRMYDETELRNVLNFAEEHGLLVISDEIYEYFRYDNRPHLSIGSLEAKPERVITMMGLSKTFSITGWRLGYVCAPKWATPAITKTNDLFYVCAPTPLQHGAIAGFHVDKKYFTDMISDFQSKRDRFCEGLTSAGLTPLVPEGSYYVLADIRGLSCSNSIEASSRILKEAKVASVPGEAFFTSDKKNHFVRFCFAVSEEILNGAINNLKSFNGVKNG